MINPDTLQAFVLAAELGSFSAVARRMGKAQSAISTAIANLEIDCGLELFDRSGRSPVLTDEGQALLPHAKGILLGNRELLAKAGSMAEGIESRLCLSIEMGLSIRPLRAVLEGFSKHYASVSLDILNPSPTETPTLLKKGLADIGLMTEQEGYPLGFQFRGVGYSKLVPVCAPDHPLAAFDRVGYRDLRAYRQLTRIWPPTKTTGQANEKKSASTWHSENPALTAELVRAGFGWAELPVTAVAEQIADGRLVQLAYAFQQSDILEGIDIVWTEQRALGVAGQWLRDEILKLPQTVWQEG